MSSDVVGRSNPALKQLRALFRDSELRRREGVAVSEGPNVAESVLAAAAELRLVAVDEGSLRKHAALLEKARDAGARLMVCPAGALDTVAQARSSQGLVIVATRPAPLDALELLRASFLIVATVSDPGNAGTLIRSAAAFGADGILLGQGSVDAYNPKTLRASAGALFSMPIMEADVPISTLLEAPRASGMRCIAAEATGTAASTIDLTQPLAIVLGHERHGVDPGLRVDGTIAAPVSASVDSLNVGTAGAVLAYEVARQRGFPKARA